MSDQKKPEALEDSDLDDAAGALKIQMNDLLISSYQTGGSAVDAKPSYDGQAIDYGVVARKDIRRG